VETVSPPPPNPTLGEPPGSLRFRASPLEVGGRAQQSSRGVRAVVPPRPVANVSPTTFAAKAAVPVRASGDVEKLRPADRGSRGSLPSPPLPPI